MEKTGSPSTTFIAFPFRKHTGQAGHTTPKHYSNRINKSGSGFTVLELLVVVAVIGMLASVVLVLMGGTKEKTRDTKRMEDMRQMQNALNLYYTNNNRFPVEPSPVTITGSDSFSNALIGENAIQEVPPDPLYPSSAYQYTYESDNGTSFTITFCLETDSIAGYSEGCGNTINP